LTGDQCLNVTAVIPARFLFLDLGRILQRPLGGFWPVVLFFGGTTFEREGQDPCSLPGEFLATFVQSSGMRPRDPENPQDPSTVCRVPRDGSSCTCNRNVGGRDCRLVLR